MSNKAGARVEHALPALVEQVDDRKYRVRSWLKYNKSAAEIRELREERVQYGRRGGLSSGEKRAQRGKQTGSSLLDESEASPEASETETDRKTEKKEESDPTPETETISLKVDTADPRFGEVCRLYGQRVADRAAHVHDRDKYIQAVEENFLLEHGNETRQLLADHPSESAEEIVDRLERVGDSVQRRRSYRDPNVERDRARRVVNEVAAAMEAANDLTYRPTSEKSFL
ncbi:MAG: hypothetical protein ACLP36_02200 [Acidimicrobiales bacterium]